MSLIVIICVFLAVSSLNWTRRRAFHNPNNQGMQRTYGFARSLLVSVFWIYMIIVTPIAIRRFASFYDAAILGSGMHNKSHPVNEIRATDSSDDELSLADFFLPPLPLSWSDKH